MWLPYTKLGLISEYDIWSYKVLILIIYIEMCKHG